MFVVSWKVGAWFPLHRFIRNRRRWSKQGSRPRSRVDVREENQDFLLAAFVLCAESALVFKGSFLTPGKELKFWGPNLNTVVYQGEKDNRDVIQMSSPQWKEMLLLITYDEHGGFYDHVPTPVKNVPSPDGLVGPSPYYFAFDRLGVRVPTIAISPWINKGTGLSSLADLSPFQIIVAIQNLVDLVRYQGVREIYLFCSWYSFGALVNGAADAGRSCFSPASTQVTSELKIHGR
ncbi:hypothetical protein R1sor_004219 [Riccia sorocarpa]|uniref:Uncharacterized protein n=1 Tax=Riccia sorocarpa TaxID=122646 RepID=A0ABD3H6N8_9MARC